MIKSKHVLGISGGKDSAALAIYLKDKHPELDIDYYFTDTGKELDETYQLIERLESYLGKKVNKLEDDGIKSTNEDPFDYYYKSFKGYLPSPQARWCTALMKLKPFEKFIGDKPTVSYVGIREDENREGYISKKSNIQSIFPFRRNIWSKGVLQEIFNPKNQEYFLNDSDIYYSNKEMDTVLKILEFPISFSSKHKVKRDKAIYTKLEKFLSIDIIKFNKSVFHFLKRNDYPITLGEESPLLENEDGLVRDDIFKLLRKSNVGIPEYYNKIEFEVNGKKGEYARSRSGCFFCFFQRKIEWVWLFEQHPDLFKKAMSYENKDEAFTWMRNESLKELTHPNRIRQIKLHHINRTNREESKGSKLLLDKLIDAEENSCITCFI